MIPQATADLYRSNRRRVAALLPYLHREWGLIGEDLELGWQQRGPRITALTSAAIAGAAADGASSVPTALAQNKHFSAPLFRIDPMSFGSVANLAPYGDGSGAAVPLGRHLYGAVIRARSAAADSLDERLLIGRQALDQLVHTQVVDAARSASQVTVAATPRTGYIRYVNPPCCQDCAVQAGRFFRWNQGFERHPNCDCVHVPWGEGEPVGYTTDVPLDQIKDLTVGQRMALEDGADLSQVVNAYRNTPTSKSGRKLRDKMGDYTVEGTTRSGWASYIQREMARQRATVVAETLEQVGRRGYIANYAVRRTGLRPTPDAIYRFAASREEALILLHANGYIVGNISQIAAIGNRLHRP